MKKSFSFLTLPIIAAFVLLKVDAQNLSPYWSLAGNNNASAASKLGTTNSFPLRLFTNNRERLRIDADGKVGIGTATPRGRLTLFNSGSTPAASWVTAAAPMFVSYAENTGGSGDHFLAMASNTRTTRPNILGRRARGTLATPLAVVENDFVTSYQASAYDGSAFQNPANIDFFVDGAPSAGHVPVRISLTTGSNVSNRLERLKIGSTGNIAFNVNQLYLNNLSGNIGIGTTAPVNKLDVMGTIRGYVPSYDDEGNPTGGGVGVEGYGSIGVKATSDYENGTGIEANGFIGINATGHDIGMIASSPNFSGIFGGSGAVNYIDYLFDNAGVIGASETNMGVEGVGVLGVVGRGREWGVFGQGDIGIYGVGTTYAGKFDGPVLLSEGYTTSDKNLKKNIKEFTGAMNLINKLKPKYYEFKDDAKLASLRLPKGAHYGLIAQDVQAILPSLVKDAPHSLFDTNPKDGMALPAGEMPKPEVLETINIKAVNYTELIPIIVKGMQELDEKTEEIAELKEEIAEFRQIVLRLENGSNGTVTLSSAQLEQNSPNPVVGTTTIRYQVPASATSAKLTVTDAKGRLVRTVNISNKGVGQVNLNTSMLAAGNYNYTLWVDGRQASTNRLVVTQ